jgi:hypothetical protein
MAVEQLLLHVKYAVCVCSSPCSCSACCRCLVRHPLAGALPPLGRSTGGRKAVRFPSFGATKTTTTEWPVISIPAHFRPQTALLDCLAGSQRHQVLPDPRQLLGRTPPPEQQKYTGNGISIPTAQSPAPEPRAEFSLSGSGVESAVDGPGLGGVPACWMLLLLALLQLLPICPMS